MDLWAKTKFAVEEMVPKTETVYKLIAILADED